MCRRYTGAPYIRYHSAPGSFAQLYCYILYGQISQSPSVRSWRYYRSNDTYLFDERVIKNMALNRYGIAWLPIWSIVNELQTKRLVRLDAANLIVPIQAYIYRMNTRLNRNAENFWRILQEHTPNDLIHKASMIQPVRRY